jgi:hypothetical protein
MSEQKLIPVQVMAKAHAIETSRWDIFSPTISRVGAHWSVTREGVAIEDGLLLADAEIRRAYLAKIAAMRAALRALAEMEMYPETVIVEGEETYARSIRSSGPYQGEITKSFKAMLLAAAAEEQ